MSVARENVNPLLSSAQEHIELLTRDRNTPVNIRLIDDDRTRQRDARNLHGSITKLWPLIEEAQADGFGVFVVVNDGGHKDKDIAEIRAIFIDCDDGRAFEHMAWHCEPSFIVETARGWHAYWRSNDVPVKRFRQIQRQLAAHYGGDRAVINPSRVMRLAGTLHQKITKRGQKAKSVLVKLAVMAGGEPYDGRELAMNLPALPTLAERAPSAAKGKPVPSDHLEKLLGCVDPFTERDGWLTVIGGIRASNVPGDDDESVRLDLALRWSRGEFWWDNDSSVNPKYTGDDDVVRAFETMPPKAGGAGYGTVYHLAKEGGFEGPPARPSRKEMCADLPALKEANTAPGEAVPRHRFTPGDFACNSKTGEPYKNQHNIMIAFDLMGVRLRYDEFADSYWVREGTGSEQRLTDSFVDDLRFRVEREHNFIPGKELFSDVVGMLARSQSSHPVLDFLDAAESKWDGQNRIDDWLVRYFGAEDTDYVRAIGKIMLVAAVRRIRQPGCKYDELVVLESPQGQFKSSALAVLAVRPEWFTDSVKLSADSKVAIEQTRGKWIVEIAEMQGLRRADVDHVKAFLSRTEDSARLSYDRMRSDVPRKFVCVGTQNAKNYLADTTGNRRFWPVTVSTAKISDLVQDRDQLWGEAAALERQGVSIRLPRELWPAAAAEQRKREVVNPYLEMVQAAFAGHASGKIPSVDVYRMLKIADGPQASAQRQELANLAMQAIGWEKRMSIRFEGGRVLKGFYRGGSLADGPSIPPPLLSLENRGGSWLAITHGSLVDADDW